MKNKEPGISKTDITKFLLLQLFCALLLWVAAEVVRGISKTVCDHRNRDLIFQKWKTEEQESTKRLWIKYSGIVNQINLTNEIYHTNEVFIGREVWHTNEVTNWHDATNHILENPLWNTPPSPLGTNGVIQPPYYQLITTNIINLGVANMAETNYCSHWIEGVEFVFPKTNGPDKYNHCAIFLPHGLTIPSAAAAWLLRRVVMSFTRWGGD